ncbi:hypothetical protein SteCoe_31703 [Stentor coeruleus]|uniref:Uncharacterized protein n=1 Tax=Stentor coeruleus TaxID=5963 RepID=A0A1R2B0N8_9CILI|nr:hypothetical protein SteCoe_31703 [Stentor coeruleus]
MGCCSNKQEIISPMNKTKDPSQEELKETLLSYVNIFLEDYEKLIKKKIIPNRPRAMHEFDKIVKHSINTIFQKYKEITATYSKKEYIQSEIKKYSLYLISKCKSREGYYRFINNLYSFEYANHLKKHLIQELNNSNITSEACINQYNKLAKGSYVIEGLQDLYDVLELPAEKRLNFLNDKASKIKQELEDDRKQLIRIFDNIDLPLVSEEITSTNISYFNALESSSGEYIESQNYEIDFEVLENAEEPQSKRSSTYLDPNYHRVNNNYIYK